MDDVWLLAIHLSMAVLLILRCDKLVVGLSRL